MPVSIVMCFFVKNHDKKQLNNVNIQFYTKNSKQVDIFGYKYAFNQISILFSTDFDKIHRMLRNYK